MYAVDKDLYCFSGSCTKFKYSCSARQILMSFFSRISTLDSMAKCGLRDHIWPGCKLQPV